MYRIGIKRGQWTQWGQYVSTREEAVAIRNQASRIVFKKIKKAGK